MIYIIADHTGVSLKNKGIDYGFFGDGDEVKWDNFFECSYNAECWRRKFQYQDIDSEVNGEITTLRLTNK